MDQNFFTAYFCIDLIFIHCCIIHQTTLIVTNILAHTCITLVITEKSTILVKTVFTRQHVIPSLQPTDEDLTNYSEIEFTEPVFAITPKVNFANS